MGGSLGLALQENRVCRQVVGLVRRQSAVDEAMRLGVVHEAAVNPAEALAQADLVIFSTPVRIIIQQMAHYAPLCKPGVVFTDMGSTKQAIVQAMAGLPPHVHPVGSHPMCGKELTGMAAAEADLYRGAPWIVTPLTRTPPAATAMVQELAQAIGARPRFLEAARHDRLVAAISHLPYAMAAALVLAAQQVAHTDPAVWEVAASGFRDTSRVAASDVTMMLDILLTNHEAVQALLGLARQQLDTLAQALAQGDETTLRRLMETAAAQRRELYQ